MDKENKEQGNERPVLFVMATRGCSNLVGRLLRWRNEMAKISGKKFDKSAIIYRPIESVNPGEQDIIFAGGRRDDERFVQAMKGSGQIIVRYSQLGLRAPYSGRTAQELGYSFMMEKYRDRISYLTDNEGFLEGVLARDSNKILESLGNTGVWCTGYLEECCKIPVKSTPSKYIDEAIANEEQALLDLRQSEARAYWSS